MKMNQKKQLGKKQRTFCIMDQQVILISAIILVNKKFKVKANFKKFNKLIKIKPETL